MYGIYLSIPQLLWGIDCGFRSFPKTIVQRRALLDFIKSNGDFRKPIYNDSLLGGAIIFKRNTSNLVIAQLQDLREIDIIRHLRNEGYTPDK